MASPHPLFIRLRSATAAAAKIYFQALPREASLFKHAETVHLQAASATIQIRRRPAGGGRCPGFIVRSTSHSSNNRLVGRPNSAYYIPPFSCTNSTYKIITVRAFETGHDNDSPDRRPDLLPDNVNFPSPSSSPSVMTYSTLRRRTLYVRSP